MVRREGVHARAETIPNWSKLKLNTVKKGRKRREDRRGHEDRCKVCIILTSLKPGVSISIFSSGRQYTRRPTHVSGARACPARRGCHGHPWFHWRYLKLFIEIVRQRPSVHRPTWSICRMGNVQIKRVSPPIIRALTET